MSSSLSRSRLFTAVAAAAALLIPVAISGAPAQATPGFAGDSEAALRQQVTALAHQTVEASELAGTAWADTKVEIMRQEDGWAFGMVVLVAPRVEHAQPRDWLFLAELRDGTWHVSLDGQDEFAQMSAHAPVVTAQERPLFADLGSQSRTQANGDWRTGVRLPFAVGQSWYLRGGPHAYDAGSGPWSSVDLSGGDEMVRAARAGTAYTPCVGLVRIVHDRGYSTRYYHLVSHPWYNGQWVAEGTFIGYTGVEIGCGGAASGRHVHFSLEQNGVFVPIAYHLIGGWVFMNGSQQYYGHALHGSTIQYAGSGYLYNYGVIGFNQGVVDTYGGGTLNKRSGPGTGYPVVGSVGDGAIVTISCSAWGTTHSGRWGSTSLWNRLSDGTWVSDAYLYTGSNNPVNGWC